MLLCKISKSWVQVSQLKSNWVPSSRIYVEFVAIFISHVQHFTKALFSNICDWKDQYKQLYFLPQFRLLQLIQKPAHPCVLKIGRGSSSLCMSISISCMVELHSLMLLANGSTNQGKTSGQADLYSKRLCLSFTAFWCST